MSDLSASFGVRLDDWQDAVLQAAMGERSDGTWAADVVGLSVPRQNGKSQLLVARALAGALLFGETKIIISAHSQDTAREAFAKLLDMRDNSPALAERVDKVLNALNREYVKFKNGAMIQFKARTVSGARGFSCDCLLLDEAQILAMPAWVSIRSTMSARPNPQVWLLGTPPTPEDNGEVFAAVRESAKQGKARRTAWLEWSAEPDDDPALEETRAKANPAWFTRINHEVVQGEFETYPPDRFAHDRLGVWREDQLKAQIVIPPDRWDTLSIPESAAPGEQVAPDALGLDRWHDGSTSVAGAWLSEDWIHLELVAADVIDDTTELVKWLVQQAGRRVPVLIASDSPAAALEPDLAARGVAVRMVSRPEYGRACGGLHDDAFEGNLTHIGQEYLTAAVRGAKKGDIGRAGAWGWDRQNPENDISPLVAATLARHGAVTAQAKKPSLAFAF